MRLSLGESQRPLAPMVFIFTQSLTFTPQNYIDMGYLYYDVMCIGASGGYGGTVGSVNPGYGGVIAAGGAPGGGGSHLIRNRVLSELASSVPVVVGTAGAAGTSAGTSPTVYTVATNGGNGGYSSFNTNTCKASGGLGGKKAITNGAGSVTTFGYGGAGGKGNQTTAGGGLVPASRTALFNGSWDGSIGTGGSGGAGGAAYWATGTIIGIPSVGAYGAYPSENSAAQSRKPPFSDLIVDSVNATGGGGAKPYTLTAATKVYGTAGITSATSSPNGVVVLRLYT